MSEPKEVSGLEAAVNTALVEIPLPVNNLTEHCERYEDTHDRKLAALNQEVEALPDITDAKTYDANQKQRTKLIGIRTGMDKYRKDVFAPMRALKEKFDAYIGTTPDSGLQAKVKAMELVIEAKQKVWDDQQEEIRRAAQELIQRRNQQRAQTLMDMLFHYDGARYTLGQLVKSDQDLRTEPDEVFQRFVLAAGPEAERQKRKLARIEELKSVGWEHIDHQMVIQLPSGSAGADVARLADMALEEFRELYGIGEVEVARRAELKRLEAEQNERNRLAFEEQGRKQRENDEARAQIDRDKAQLRSDRISLRMDQMVALGARTFTKFGAAWIGQEGLDFTGWAVETLADISDEHWAATKQRVSEEAAEVKRREDEAYAKAQRKEIRAEKLVELYAKYDGDSVWKLGEATVTDSLLANMDEEAWEKVLVHFRGWRKLFDNLTATIAPVQVIEEEEPLVGEGQPLATDAEIMTTVLHNAGEFLALCKRANDCAVSDNARSTYAIAIDRVQSVITLLDGTIQNEL